MFILKKTILFCFVLCFYNLSFSQNEKISYQDSIKKYLYNQPDKAINFSHRFLNESKRENDIDNTLMAYATLAVEYEIKNEIDSTLYYYHKGLEIAKESRKVIDFKYSIGSIYEKQYNYSDALLLYKQCLELSKKEGFDDLENRTLVSIASIKNKIGESKEALTLLEEVYNKRKKSKSHSLRYTRVNLIKTYLNNEMVDRALALSEEGIDEAKKAKNLEFLYYCQKLKAEALLKASKWDMATTSIKSAMETANRLKNNGFIDESNYILALINYKTLKPNVSIALLDTIIKDVSKKTPEKLSKYYKLIADSYKDIDSVTLSNEYYQKFIIEEKKVSQKKLSTLETIHKIVMKEEISEKEKQKKTKWLWTGISATLLLFIVTLILLFKNKSKVNQKRFDDLMLKIKDFEERKAENKQIKTDNGDVKEQLVSKKETVNLSENFEAEKKEEEEKKELTPEELPTTNLEDSSDTSYVIDDKKIEEILVKLQNLEDKLYFLRQDCTLHNMAKRLKTNTSYLSKIINTHLDKSFSTYINELRINYAIIELKNNKKLRSYSVKGIAEEMGYKNADAFSRYFRSATGISPSVYIKKIREI